MAFLLDKAQLFALEIELVGSGALGPCWLSAFLRFATRDAAGNTFHAFVESSFDFYVPELPTMIQDIEGLHSGGDRMSYTPSAEPAFTLRGRKEREGVDIECEVDLRTTLGMPRSLPYGEATVLLRLKCSEDALRLFQSALSRELEDAQRQAAAVPGTKNLA